MQAVSLPGSGLTLSRIALGTASLHHLFSRHDRRRLVGRALDAGITHFDCSPYYGDGVGEATLAALPPRVTIATKVGLLPRGGAHGVAWLAQARRVAGRAWPALTRPVVDFSVAAAARSLDGSLRRLSRQRVDILLLHEPRAELLASDEWRRWFERERARGRVAAFGVAGEASGLVSVLDLLGDLVDVIQTRDSLARREAMPLRRAGHAPHITYGHLARREAARDAGAILRETSVACTDTVLLVSTRRADRIPELATAGASP